MDKSELEYILAANKTALSLYKQSKEVLVQSDNYDFMVFKFSKWEEVLKDLEEWEDYISIDEVTFDELYHNLCVKLRERINYL